MIDCIEIELRGRDRLKLYIDVYDNSLSRKWLAALNDLLARGNHLEKNFCFLGFVEGNQRDGAYVLDQVNRSIAAINSANLGYDIDDYFALENTLTDQDVDGRGVGRNIVHSKFNQLHRYFEDLQGVSGSLSPYYQRADADTRWHIRQLNLLCHEFESWALSYRKQLEAPEWQRPSQLMCWLNAPRFVLEPEDYELFGVDTISRGMGGVYVGVNKAVGKHHWEVFNDEGADSRLHELTTTTLRNQTEAAGDFDIEWGQDPSEFEWQQARLDQFRSWLVTNGFDPEDKSLTIGHPKVAQVNLLRSFGTVNCREVWTQLNKHLDVSSVRTGTQYREYPYHWSDGDFKSKQIEIIRGNTQ